MQVEIEASLLVANIQMYPEASRMCGHIDGGSWYLKPKMVLLLIMASLVSRYGDKMFCPESVALAQYIRRRV